jgi:hypothetical protein
MQSSALGAAMPSDDAMGAESAARVADWTGKIAR